MPKDSPSVKSLVAVDEARSSSKVPDRASASVRFREGVLRIENPRARKKSEISFFIRAITKVYLPSGRRVFYDLDTLEYRLSSSISAQTKTIKMAETAIAMP
jgi:hypothetical protein